VASNDRLSLCVKAVYVKFVLGLLGIGLSGSEIIDVSLGLGSLGFNMVLLVEICGGGEVNRGAVLRRGGLLFVGHHHRLVHGGDSDVQLNAAFLARLAGGGLSRLL